jgi:site-specific DNA-cytosine methylase
MNVLSLFDGISCGQVALQRAGIKVDKYYASEIDKYAIQVTRKNFPNTINLGDVTKLDGKKYKGIDLLIGGSPCQSLSITQSQIRQHLFGKSKLFFEFVRVLEESEPKYFLFENVASMTEESKKIISELLKCEPVFINSNAFVAQDRPRYYWTNIPLAKTGMKECNINLQDILEPAVDEKYFYNCGFDFLGLDKSVCAILHINGHDILKRVHSPQFKSHTLTTCGGGNTQKKVFIDGRPRKLTPIEYERLQGLPDNYTHGISNTRRYTAIGNGWTVDVIANILRSIPAEMAKEVTA